MQKIAMISAGKVADIIAADDNWASSFPKWIAAPDWVTIGTMYVDGAFVEPEASVPSADELKSYAAKKRWLVETGGISPLGFPIATGREDRGLLYEAEASAKASSSFSTTWIATDGSSHELSSEMVIALATAVRAHVAGCFLIYSDIVAEITSGSITATDQIDTAEWPTNS